MENQEYILTAEALDAIGEIMNISMGSAATAVSNMLDKQVTITTPKLEQQLFKDIDCSELEPAVIVQIKYVEGIEGVNVIMLKKKDMQIILNLLMGNEFGEEAEGDEFVFDELSMSAACEVMNQMMGASATALSEILGMPINISTPEAKEARTKDEINVAFNVIGNEEQVVAISFHMMIKDALDTTFACFLNADLATRIVNQVSSSMDEEAAPPPPQPEVPQPQMQQPQMQQPQMQQPQMQQPQMQQPQVQQPQMQQPQAQQPQMQQPQMQQPQMQQPQPMGAAQPYTPPDFSREPMQFATQPVPFPEQPQMPGGYPGTYPQQQGMPPYGQQPYGYPPQPGYGYPPQQPYGYPPQAGPGGYVAPPQNVKSAEFPDFSRQMGMSVSPNGSNMNLLLNVQLDVTVIIGRAKRKIREIVEFGQGTVVELDKQTGAPAEIMVNGQLLAYGEVIVVGDNFGVRVTEIVGTKELLELLDSNT